MMRLLAAIALGAMMITICACSHHEEQTSATQSASTGYSK